MRSYFRWQRLYLVVFWVGLALFLASYYGLKEFILYHQWPRGKLTTINSLTVAKRIVTDSVSLSKSTDLEKIMNDRINKLEYGKNEICPFENYIQLSSKKCQGTNVTQSSSSFKSIPKSFKEIILPPVPLPSCQTINPWKMVEETKMNDSSKFSMLFLIKSSTNNFLRRKIIRQTWGGVASLYDMKFLVMFVLGNTLNIEHQNLINKENKIYGDLLQCSFNDTYRMLPDKVLSAFGWLLKKDIKIDFATVTDDDCLLNLKNIYRSFRTNHENDVIYCGFQFGKDRKPIKNPESKWYVNTTIYPEEVYPAFCHGGMWTLSRSFIQKLYCTAEITNRSDFHLEDVYITGVLRSKATCDERTVVDRWKHHMVKHIATSNNLYRTFIGYWRIWNATLPWKQKGSKMEDGTVKLRYIRHNS